jgi:DNA-directed RNA polymerase sigma subunit (sigma70/sigma32)
VTTILQLAGEPVSLTETAHDGDGSLHEVIEDHAAEEPFDVAATSLLHGDLVKLLEPLGERERKIIWLRFGLDRGEPRSLAEVAVHFNLTRERIRQIEVHSLAVLRQWRADDEARDLLSV